MAYRQIHVKIWKDSWFINLPIIQKLHFIYLFSNELASVAGIYELPITVQAFETGIKQEEIKKNLDDFEEAGKIVYDQKSNVIWVKMLRKYNANPSPTVTKKILKDLKTIPGCELKAAYCLRYNYNLDTVSIGYVYSIDPVKKPNPLRKEKKGTITGKEQEQEQEQEQEKDGIDTVPIGYEEDQEKYVI